MTIETEDENMKSEHEANGKQSVFDGNLFICPICGKKMCCASINVHMKKAHNIRVRDFGQVFSSEDNAEYRRRRNIMQREYVKKYKENKYEELIYFKKLEHENAEMKQELEKSAPVWVILKIENKLGSQNPVKVAAQICIQKLNPIKEYEHCNAILTVKLNETQFGELLLETSENKKDAITKAIAFESNYIQEAMEYEEQFKRWDYSAPSPESENNEQD